MQIVHNFNISPREYFQRGKENDFPSINICPCCAYPSTLPKHGFYWRNALFLKFHYRIPIIRFKCPSCGRTISLLPRGTILELREQRRNLPVSMFYEWLVQKGTIRITAFS
jgi:hypothetical protein